MALWTKVVGIFTGVLVVVGCVQACSFIQSERASVYVNIEQISQIAADKPISASLTFINAGRSQAFITKGKATLSFFYKVPDQPPLKDIPFNLAGAIPAQGTRYWPVGPSKEPLNWAQVDEIETGRMKIYIYGYASYTDDFTVFGPRTIGFCGVYSPGTQTMAQIPPFDECPNTNYVYYR
jgi:hypothetical protein